jgi:hypothetical protein
MKSALHLARQRAPLLLLAMALMILTLAASLLGLMVDERVITGAPAWLKPAKFSASVAIYTATVAWILTVLPAERGLRRAGHLMGVLLIVEVALIVLQVGRGTTSHFNVATPFEARLFRVMGGVIATVMFTTMYVLWRAARVTLPDAGLAATIRWGLTISILGGWLGAVMTVPNRAQRETLAAGQEVSFQGGHAVGATEDGPGLPLVRWSTTGGDLRVPHFVGLHAMQLLPLALLLRRRRHGPRPADPFFVRSLAAAWFALVALTFVQALAGRPFIPFTGS